MKKLGHRGRVIARRMAKRGWKWFRSYAKGTKNSGIRKLYLPHARSAWLNNNKHLRRR